MRWWWSAGSIDGALATLAQALAAIESVLGSLEERMEGMATRADVDAVKAAILQAITDAATRVSTDIQALRDQLATGVAVTDQDLADFQADVTAIGQIDPPTPAPGP